MGFPNVTLKDDSAEEFTLDAKNIKIDSENENEDNHEIKKEQIKAVIEAYKEEIGKNTDIAELQEEYRRGIAVGSQAVCEVILEKLNNRSIPLVKKIADIRAFCKRPFGREPKAETGVSNDN